MAVTFPNGRKIKIIISINIVLAVLLLIYIFNLLATEWLPISEKEPNFWWPLGIIISIISFAILNIQLTMDVILFKSFTHTAKAIETCKMWLKMCIGFEVLQIAIFFSSLFYSEGGTKIVQSFPDSSLQLDASPLDLAVKTGGVSISSMIVFSLVGLGILFRAFGIYIINTHILDLKSLLPPTLLPGQSICFITLAPDFYRSQSEHSVNNNNYTV